MYRLEKMRGIGENPERGEEKKSVLLVEAVEADGYYTIRIGDQYLRAPVENFQTAYEEEKKPTKDSVFDRAADGGNYYCIGLKGNVTEQEEEFDEFDDEFFNTANYCKDEQLMHQRALHEILMRRLWRFSMMNGGPAKWDGEAPCYYISYNVKERKYMVDCSYMLDTGVPSFNDDSATKAAIDEVVLPFVEAHPDYIW